VRDLLALPKAHLHPHAGEFAGPASVRAAIEVLHARRILHGVRAVEDPGLLREVAARGICFDVCLTSNVKLGVVPPSSSTRYRRCWPPEWPAARAPMTLLFGASLLDEYNHARTTLGLHDTQLADIARASLRSSGAPGPYATVP
jgi:adenosine deaminase